VFGVSESSPFDLKFRLLDAPVRITGWFWLVALMIGPRDPQGAILWTLAVLVSILIHEFGHGLMARLFGHRFEVTLHGMGGFCTYDSAQDTTGKRLAVLASGPGAQFLFLVLICMSFGSWLGLSTASNLALARGYLGFAPVDLEATTNILAAVDRHGITAFEAYEYLFQINLLWPLLNLLPIWPLDGGQMTCESLAHVNPRDGRRWGHIVSLLTAGLLIIYVLYQARGNPGDQPLFRVLWFGFFAFLNYQVLQGYHARYRTYGPDDDRDWR
jgi:Zn-dependent protease